VFASNEIVGTWTGRAARQRLRVSVDLFEPVDNNALAAAVVDYGRITGHTAQVVRQICQS